MDTKEHRSEYCVRSEQFLTHNGGPIAEDFQRHDLKNALVEGNILANAIIQLFGKYRYKRVYKDSGVGWLLVSSINVCQQDNEKLRAINKHLKSEYEI